jgi:hypothetical protein
MTVRYIHQSPGFYGNPKFWHAALNNIIELATRARDEGTADVRIPEIEQEMRAER